MYIDYALLAQLVEQLPLKEMVVGSTPTRGTTYKSTQTNLSVYFVYVVHRSKQTTLLACRSRKPFPYECIHEWKRLKYEYLEYFRTGG